MTVVNTCLVEAAPFFIVLTSFVSLLQVNCEDILLLPFNDISDNDGYYSFNIDPKEVFSLGM
jgi:hypothetical protein